MKCIIFKIVKFAFHVFSYFLSRIKILFAFGTVLTFALLVQKKWLVNCWHLSVN